MGRLGPYERAVAFHPAAGGFHRLHGLGMGRKVAYSDIRSGVSARNRRDIVDDPDAAAVGGQDQVRCARMNDEVAHRDAGKLLPLYWAQRWPPSMLIHKSELRAEEEQVGIDRVFVDDVGIAAHAVLPAAGSAFQVLP